MAGILSKIESLLDSAVASGLAEAANDMEIKLQKNTAGEIKKDKRSLRAADNETRVEEAEGDEEDEESKPDDSGGDMSKRPVITPDKLPATITVDMVINGIDAIRSARSLKKPDVREEFEEYFNGLSADEKVGLLAIVYGIAETLIGDSPGRGLDPSDEPYNVQMSSDPEQSRDATKAVAPSAKGDSDDTPIVVGG
jgi:hypothetical protein